MHDVRREKEVGGRREGHELKYHMLLLSGTSSKDFVCTDVHIIMA